MLVQIGDDWINPDRVAWIFSPKREAGKDEMTRVFFSGHEEDYMILRALTYLKQNTEKHDAN